MLQDSIMVEVSFQSIGLSVFLVDLVMFRIASRPHRTPCLCFSRFGQFGDHAVLFLQVLLFPWSLGVP
jgi:hypothetical protein